MGSPTRLGVTRRVEIASVVNTQGEASVAELAQRFAVSDYTVRRDLDSLSAQGLVIRTHGGAVSATAPVKPDSDFDIRLGVHSARKDAIGKLAASLVQDNTSCIINSGTTSLALARHLGKRRDLTIVTNNIRLPSVLDERVYRDLYMIGGQVRMVSQATVGPVVLTTGSDSVPIRVRAKMAFIGIGAVDADLGFSTSSVSEAAVMRDIASCAENVTILADATKMQQHLFSTVGPLELADTLVTDERPPELLEKALLDAGVQVLVAGGPALAM